MPHVQHSNCSIRYGRIVERTLDPESAQSTDAHQLLTLLVCARRPLRWHEIQGAVSISLEDMQIDLPGMSFRVSSKELCGSLIELRPKGSIELVHMTAK